MLSAHTAIRPPFALIARKSIAVGALATSSNVQALAMRMLVFIKVPASHSERSRMLNCESGARKLTQPSTHYGIGSCRNAAQNVVPVTGKFGREAPAINGCACKWECQRKIVISR